MMQARDKILVSDFDGTMTERDFFRVALSRLPPGAAATWERYEQGLTSHFDALAAIFSGLRVDQQGFDALLAEMRVEVGLAESLDHLQQAGWSLVIASAGCFFYIERILLRTGITAVIHANPGDFIPGQGLIMKPPLQSPFFAAETGIDKAAIVRHYHNQGLDTAFAGDGHPDLAPALLVPPERRFARGWLADELETRREPFVRFARWRDIAVRLCGGAAGIMHIRTPSASCSKRAASGMRSGAIRSAGRNGSRQPDWRRASRKGSIRYYRQVTAWMRSVPCWRTTQSLPAVSLPDGQPDVVATGLSTYLSYLTVMLNMTESVVASPLIPHAFIHLPL